MKFKVVAFVLLFVVLSIVSLYSVMMYQQVPALEFQAGQVLNQVKITRFEYNTSDPFLVTGTHSEASFQCNVTYNNPSDTKITISDISAGYYRSTPESKYQYYIAYGLPNGTSVLNPGSLVITIEFKYDRWTNLPETNDTSPFFQIGTTVSQDPYTRHIDSEVYENRIENKVDEGAILYEINVFRSFYSVLAVAVWIVGLGPAFIVMLFVSKSKLQIERWVACVFAVNVYSVFIASFMRYFPQPPPIETSFSGQIGIASALFGFLLLLAFIVVGGLNLITLVSLLRGSPYAKDLSYLAGGIVAAAGLYLSIVLFFRDWHSIIFWASAVLAVVNIITLLRLRQINLKK